MNLETAKRLRVCRICEEPISASEGSPLGWEEDFGERLFPLPALTLNFGKEFAHTLCLALSDPEDEDDSGNDFDVGDDEE